VQFVDSDDYISLDACEKLYNKCEDLQLDMLSFAGINFENETGKTMVSSYYNFKWLPAKLDKDILYCNWRKYMPYMAVSAALTIYNKNFIKSHDITFPERIYFEDNLFFVKAILNAQKFSILKEILYFRRVHKESTTQNLDKNYADFLIISDMVLSYVKIHNKQMLDRYIKQYLMLCIRGYDKLSPEIKISQEKNLRKLLLRYNYSDYNIQYPKSVKSICLKLLHLPFYLYCMYKRLVNLYRRLIANEKVLHTFRIDMKNYGTRNNSIEIRAKDVLVTKTKWNTDEKGIGIMIQGHLMRQNIHIKIIGNGVLKFSFRGPDKRCNGKRYPVYIDYKSIKIDDKELLSMPITTWHDKASAYEMNVTDGKEILLSIEQRYHNYSSNELKDMVTKLNFADKN